MGIFQNNLMGAAAAAASAGGSGFYDYQIANSIRGSADGDTTLKFTAGTPTSTTKMTMSFWVKRHTPDSTNAGANNVFTTGTGGGNYFYIAYNATLTMENTGGNQGVGYLLSEEKYRDPGAWYHVILRIDTSQSTQFDRIRVYVNGRQLGTSPSPDWRNQTMITNTAQDETFSYLNADGLVQSWGGLSGKGHGTEGADLSLADVMFFDGQSYYSELGEYKNGVWIPKDPSGLTFGNNGYWLKFESSSDLGNDSSGNNNDFTVANFAAHDQLTDTPTFNSNSNGGNYCTLNPLNTRGSTAVATQLTEGNLKWTPGATQDESSGTMSIGAGGVDKVYMEVYCENNSDTGWFGVYDQKDGSLMEAVVQSVASAVRFKPYTGDKVTAGTSSNYIGDGSSSNPSGVIFQMAVDVPAGKIWWGKNNAWGSDGADHIDDDNVAFTTLNTDGIYLLFTHTGGASIAQPDWVFNFGQDGTFAGNKTAQGNSDDTGYGDFYYSPPTGFLALCSGNASVAAEVDPAQTDDNYPQKLFGAEIYTGNATNGKTITTGFQPDFNWTKQRSAIRRNVLMDTTRGMGGTNTTANNSKYLHSDGTYSEGAYTDLIRTITSTGYTLGDGNYTNASSGTYVSWNWRANGGTTSTNSNGSVSSTVQVDPSGHFSIVQYEGQNDSWGNPETIGHGLSSAPTCIILKNRDKADEWQVFFSDYGTVSTGGSTAANASLVLNTNAALYTNQSYKGWGGVMPTSTVFTIDGNNANGASETIIAYCFANCEGYIKSGAYVGNGNDFGTFVYTGFRPALVVNKRIDSSGHWLVHDNARDTYNPSKEILLWSGDDAEFNSTNDRVDFLSNGFKIRSSNTGINGNGNDYVYFAMAHNPFKYATAR